MNTLPTDPELQRMSDDELLKLWARRPQYPSTASELDWYRVAKEMRHRRRFNPNFNTRAR